MTHTKPMKDSDGTFGDWKPTGRLCNQDGCEGSMFEREWDSSCGGYTDYQYKCNICGHKYWVDGPDS